MCHHNTQNEKGLKNTKLRVARIIVGTLQSKSREIATQERECSVSSPEPRLGMSKKSINIFMQPRMQKDMQLQVGFIPHKKRLRNNILHVHRIFERIMNTTI